MWVDDDFLACLGGPDDGLRVKAGAVLFKKGDAADAMYVVRSGELQIYDGSTLLRTVRSGDVFGEMALVEDAPRAESVRAASASEVIAINERHFLQLAERNPHFALNILRSLCARLRRANARIRAVA